MEANSFVSIFAIVATLFGAAVGFMKILSIKRTVAPSYDSDHIISMIKDLQDKIKDLHEWHDISDEDGVKRWYNKKSHEEEVKRLSSSIQELVPILAGLASAIVRLKEEL